MQCIYLLTDKCVFLCALLTVVRGAYYDRRCRSIVGWSCYWIYCC